MKLSLKSLLPARDLGWNRVKSVCGLASCHNKLMTKFVPGSRTGMYVGETWYCSADCFAMASRGILSSLSTGLLVEMPRNPRLSLGLALLAKGYITEDALRAAVVRSQRLGQDLETTLLSGELATEKQLAGARAVQWGFPVLGPELVCQKVETDLPQSLLRACQAVPLHYSRDKRLVLGFVHRVDHGVLQSIEQITGLRAEACFITPLEFSEQMNLMSAAPGYEEVAVEDPGAVAQMARTLGGFAVEVGAEEAAFTRCNASIWARVTGKQKTIDVIFAIRRVPAANRWQNSTDLPEISQVMG